MTLSENEISTRIAQIRPAVGSIHGWLNDDGVENLYRYALKAPVPNIVEVGSWRGKSTVCLASAIKDRGEGRVYAVDTWKGSEEHQGMLQHFKEGQLYNEFIENMRGLNLLDYIEPIPMDSMEASRRWPISRSIGMIYIDAAHDYLSVRRDFEFWSPFVASGGYMIFDDVPSWPGPTLLAEQLPGWYKKVVIRGNHAIFQKQ
ncbi:class I SAM-dependent methyltransferase [Paenibacillus cremeus]|uniref:Class I SAM-dependent methyltransferase n=1 Tax=Paenibacillus cremeus TaxID=2163881 RepID=A0A559KH49_9BACL|nr:class I SAM-dependent methyltransferase [Paenibacillus cremeus]TVY11436.1 class I SAM-dependent methyltransferase [Paenibacillus cremeus]